MFDFVPRMVAASLVAYWCGEFANSFVLAKMKVWTGGRYLWTRTVGSTVVGQAVDTAIVMVLAFGGSLTPSLIGKLILSGYFVFKNVLSWTPTVAVAILGTFCGILASYGLGRLSGNCIHRFDSRGTSGLRSKPVAIRCAMCGHRSQSRERFPHPSSRRIRSSSRVVNRPS